MYIQGNESETTFITGTNTFGPKKLTLILTSFF